MPVPPFSRADFDRLLAIYLEWLRHNEGCSDRTVDKYAGYLQRLAQWCSAPPADEKMRPSADHPLALTPADLNTFCGLYAHSLGIRPRSRRPLVAAVRGFYNWCAISKVLPDNVADVVPYPKAGKPLPRAISVLHAERMLMAPGIESFLGLRDTAMIAVLAGCGLRVSGLVAMNESSLQWSRLEDGAEVLSVMVTEKGKKDRLIPVPDEVALLIRAYMGHAELESIERTIGQGDRVLWVTVRNHQVPAHEYHGERRRISIRMVRKMLEHHADTAKVPAGQRHPHAFRHLYGTEMTEEDVPTLSLQALMGHANPADTEVYASLAQRKQREQVDRGNPIGKMRAPLLESLRAIGRAKGDADVRSGPSGAYNRGTRDRVKAGKR